MTEVEAILLGATIGGAVAIGATVIAYCLNRSATLETIKITEFNKAAAEFRVAFLPEIIFLKHDANIAGAGSSTDLSEFLKYGYIHRHLKALETFKTYLSPQERADIDRAIRGTQHLISRNDSSDHSGTSQRYDTSFIRITI